jgi:non-specific serine/threonine protein kinase/serine/threonine-protein kinase
MPQPTAAQWARVKEILSQLLDRDPAEHAAILSTECGEDTELRQEVESLLSYSGKTARLDQCLQRTVLELDAPARAGEWRIGELLGSGGMGAVYLGLRDDDRLPSRAAIKIVQSGSSARIIERFKLERRILAGLIHPYIARLLDASRLDDGRLYFVMEYVRGQSIDQYVAAQTLDVAAILRLFLKVCEAVQFAHQNLVIHRDIKPGNILVTEAGDPRLLDFGIAKLLGGTRDAENTDADLTQPSERMLTPASASPEQASGAVITLASDVYSLGVLLYRLLTGVSPYAGAKDFASDPGRVVREYEPPAASSACPRLRRALKGDLDNILRKALEKDPQRRYPTAHELAADIERHLNGLPVAARAPSFGYRAGKFVRRNRVAVAAAVLLILAITGGLVASLRYASMARREQIRAQRRFEALRKLTHSTLFEFHDAIRDLPGSTAARALVLHSAVEYLEQLSADSTNDPAVLNDLAEAYLNIANIEGGVRTAHLGGTAQNALDLQLKGLAIRRRLVAEHPNDAALRKSLQDALWAVAGSYGQTGHLDRALEMRLEVQRMREQVPAASFDDRVSLSTSLISISNLYRELGQYDAALDYARRAVAIRQAMFAADGVKIQRGLAIAHEYVGYARFWRREYAEAAKEHRAAVDLIEPMARADPNNADRRRVWAVAEENRGESLARSGAGREGVEHSKQALALYTELSKADPNNKLAVEDVASGTATLGFALDAAGQKRAALEWQQRARKQFESLIGGDDNFDLHQADVESLIKLAGVEAQLGHRDAARAAAQKAVERAQGLIAANPQNHDCQDALSRAQKLLER